MNWRKAIICLLFYFSRNKTLKYFNEIISVEKLSTKRINEYQETKLKNLLLHAYANVPYYRKVFNDIGVITDGNVVLSEFNNIPILTKEIVRNEFDNLKSQDINKRDWCYNTSGGSTGEPVRFIQDKEYIQWNIANKLYIKAIGGQEIGNKEVRLWGSERDILEGQEKPSLRFRNRLYNRKEFNSFRMSEKDMLSFVKDWNNFGPTWVDRKSVV